MERLTRKDRRTKLGVNIPAYPTDFEKRIYLKLFNLENLEEELGIDLITLFKAKKIYYKYFGGDTEIKESYRVYFDITDNLLNIKEYEEDEFGYQFSLEDYKKYWSLRKEDLEDEKLD